MTTSACDHCDAVARCRVPHDRVLMARVLRRLENDRRNSPLCRHLRRYVEASSCLVRDGHVDP